MLRVLVGDEALVVVESFVFAHCAGEWKVASMRSEGQEKSRTLVVNRLNRSKFK